MINRSLNHPHIVHFLGIYTDPKDQQNKYIVTEFMTKGSLDQLIQLERDSLSTKDLVTM